MTYTQTVAQTVTYMHTLHLHSHTHVHTHTHHIHTPLMHHTHHTPLTHIPLIHTHTCTHHTHTHVHMLTHKHSDMHCMSVPIATCIEWLCEMLKCTFVCEGGGGRIVPQTLQGKCTHACMQFIPPPPSPPLTNLQFIPPLPHQKPAWCWV